MSKEDEEMFSAYSEIPPTQFDEDDFLAEPVVPSRARHVAIPEVPEQSPDFPPPAEPTQQAAVPPVIVPSLPAAQVFLPEGHDVVEREPRVPARPVEKTVRRGSETPPDEQRKRPASNQRDRAALRRTAARAQEVAELRGTQTVEIAAAILGTTTEIADLTFAIVTASPRNTAVITDALSIIDAAELEAGVAALVIGRPRMKQVWTLATALGVVQGEMPASDAKAAVLLGVALRSEESQSIRPSLDRVAHLLRRQ